MLFTVYKIVKPVSPSGQLPPVHPGRDKCSKVNTNEETGWKQ